ncbi:MAG: radical SAM family heme chaperone HemW [Planctomycetales bacterium]|nr:radical SAM family heme chaperone HemW [Planctomycetales bacterium]MBN8629026.1 radical SAM family heme chaperone HemW [Planctomycetota bacterium]
MTGTTELLQRPRHPTAAYVHVPFCRHRCGYCNFTLISGRDDLIDAYLDALERELSALETPRTVETLYLGGGTPSHLPPDKLGRLLEIVDRWFPRTIGEFTIEANPLDVAGTTDSQGEERLRILRAAGVGRISLGVQSFQTEKLRVLERDHTPQQARDAVKAVKDAGFTVSLDLIFGAPGESQQAWQADLDAALALRPDHISLYGLTFERGTAFWSRRARGDLRSQEEEAERTMYLAAIDALAAGGYEHYEISNFALPGCRSRHNQTYWAAREYYAAGPGSARYLDGVRSSNHRSTTTWLNRLRTGQSPLDESEQLDPENRAREALVLGLRRVQDGVERAAFAAEFGYDVDRLGGDDLRKLLSSGLLENLGSRLRLTREGLLLGDYIWSKLLRC